MSLMPTARPCSGPLACVLSRTRASARARSGSRYAQAPIAFSRSPMRSRQARVSDSAVAAPAATRFKVSRTPSMGAARKVSLPEYSRAHGGRASRSCALPPCGRGTSASGAGRMSPQIGGDERDQRSAQRVGGRHELRRDDLAAVGPQRRLGGQPQLEDAGVVVTLLPALHDAAVERERLARYAQPELLFQFADGGVDRLFAGFYAAAGPTQAIAVGMADHEDAAIEPHGDDGAVVTRAPDEPPDPQDAI